MKKPRLFSILKNKRFDITDDDFASAEPNPFDDEETMSDFVRDPERSLAKTSRSFSGEYSGVNASRYTKMVRDVEDLDDYIDPSISRYGPDEYMDSSRFTKDEDDYYLTTKDRSYRQNEFNQEQDVDDIDADAGWLFMRSLKKTSQAPQEMEDDIEDDENFDDGEVQGQDEFMDDGEMDGEEFDDGEPEEPEQDRYDGVVRSVKGAYLVSKKQQPDETYTEVWIFNVGKKYDDEANIRKAILAGTDIDPKKNFSEDGSQEAVLTSVGNVQYLTLVGLPD